MNDPTWQVVVEVPIRIGADSRLTLFDAVARAVHDWEPADRDGWDAEVSAGPPRRHTRQRCSCGALVASCSCDEERCYRCDPWGTSACDTDPMGSPANDQKENHE